MDGGYYTVGTPEGEVRRTRLLPRSRGRDESNIIREHVCCFFG